MDSLMKFSPNEVLFLYGELMDPSNQSIGGAEK